MYVYIYIYIYTHGDLTIDHPSKLFDEEKRGKISYRSLRRIVPALDGSRLSGEPGVCSHDIHMHLFGPPI